MKTRWYKDAVIYQIYPRSFCDSNGDGIGDIKGIISKLDYLQFLGVNAVWLSPCYKSPNDDNGYDISDYRDILPEFGTLDDWKEMIDGLHKRNIKLIMDLVVNHTSDEHPWFLESKSSKDNPYRDYYIWKDGKGKNAPPNNWTSKFMGSAWQYDDTTEQYYLHLFSIKQPDLNWDNPKVREEVADICNFWLDLGVDGFRCDVISYISKPDDYKNSKMLGVVKGDDVFSVTNHWEEYITELSEKAWSRYDTLIVGECAGVDFENTKRITRESKNLLDTSFTFDHMNCEGLHSLKKVFNKFQTIDKDCWTSSYLENHDQRRSVSRYIKNPHFRVEGAKMIAAMYFLHRGTPYIYQGQEIGMTNCKFGINDFNDIMTVNILKKMIKPIREIAYKILLKTSRDNARTPMQWDASEYAGFSNNPPWIMLNPNYVEINVEKAIDDKNSILYFYKDLIAIKKAYNNIIADGKYVDHQPRSNKVYVYSHTLGDESLLILCNFTDKNQKINNPYDAKHNIELLLSNYKTEDNKYASNNFNPYECRVYHISGLN